jgi:glutathione-independent formaldehyde dehydrogenase
VRAVVYEGAEKVAIEEVEDAHIEEPTDVLMRVTSSALCGSDLHMYDGRAGADPGLVLGHEPLGTVEEVGGAVKSVKRGDRVVVPTHLYCGYCFNCRRGRSASCLTVNPGSYGAAYGYAGMGPYRGAQAELLRVPFADVNCVKLPGEPHDEFEDDFVLLADAWVTGWHATELAGVYPTATVAIFGAGAVGLLAAYSALLRGAAEVYVVDMIPERLEKAGEIGAVPIDFLEGDPVEQIVEARRRNPRQSGSLGQGDEKMMGVMCGIDCVGFQARDREESAHEHPSQIIEDLCRLINPTGTLGIAGVYVGRDPKAAEKLGKRGHLDVPWATLFRKGIRVGLGRTDDERYTVHLRNMIVSGRAKPSFVVSHHISFEEVEEAYRKFDQRKDGYVKVVLKADRSQQ